MNGMEQNNSFPDGGADRKKFWNQFKLSHILLSMGGETVVCVAHEIKPCHGKTVLVYRIKKKRISIFYPGHADDGVMVTVGRGEAKGQREGSGNHHHLFPVGMFVIQGSAKIEVPTPIGKCSTHKDTSNRKEMVLVWQMWIWFIREIAFAGDLLETAIEITGAICYHTG